MQKIHGAVVLNYKSKITETFKNYSLLSKPKQALAIQIISYVAILYYIHTLTQRAQAVYYIV